LSHSPSSVWHVWCDKPFRLHLLVFMTFRKAWRRLSSMLI
jgi:hypothetical protein